MPHGSSAGCNGGDFMRARHAVLVGKTMLMLQTLNPCPGSNSS